MISKLALAAKRVIDAAWLHGDAYDLASQAAFALESAQLLQSPETAAEVERLRIELEQRTQDLADVHADRERLRALVEQATEFRVWEPGYGLYVRRAPGTTGFAVLEARRSDKGRRAWTTEGWQYSAVVSDAELFCWPDAGTAMAEARRVMPGAVVREEPSEDEASAVDGITRRIAPTQALREAIPDDSPATILGEAFSSSLSDVVAVEVCDARTLSITIRPKTLDDWRWYQAKFSIDVATITCRGSVMTATGRRSDVTIHFVVQDVPAMQAAAATAGEGR